MKIFIDVDNTILEHTTFYNSKTEGRLHKIFNYDPISNEYAIKQMYEASVCSDVLNLTELFNMDNVYILTKTANKVYEKYKRLRLAKLFKTSVEELLSLTDSNGNYKYITVGDNVSKAKYLKQLFKLDTVSDCILVDDYSKNIIEWEADGGIGIKFNNEYNSNTHPTGGLIVTNFKLFTYIKDDKYIKNLIIDPKLYNFFTEHFPTANYIDCLSFIETDLSKRFEVNEVLIETTKNSFTEFLTNYYAFIENYKSDLLHKFIEDNYKLDAINIIINPFHYSTKFKKLIDEQSLLAIGFSKSDHDNRPKDVFISTPTELYVDKSKQNLDKAMRLIKNIGCFNLKEN